MLLFTFVKFTSKADFIYFLVYYEHKKKPPQFLVFVTVKFILNVNFIYHSETKNWHLLYLHNKEYKAVSPLKLDD